MASNHGSGKNVFRIVVALMGIMLLSFVILMLTLNSSAAQEFLIHNSSDNSTILENISNIESPGGTIRVLTSANIIQNPGFELGTTSWLFFTSGTGTFTTPSPGYEGTKAAKLALGSSGTNIQLYQTGVTLESNTLYRLSFAAYSTSGHDMKVNLFKHGSPYTNYGLAQTFNLGNNWQTFSTEFTTKGFTGTVYDGRFQFWLAPFVTGVDTYYIDDVRLEKVITGKVHNINKGTNYTTIQAAIDDASTGDEIHVDSGTYYENVNVNKQLTLRGIGMPVVDAGGRGSAITLAADGIILEGFTATGAFGCYSIDCPDAWTGVMSNNNKPDNSILMPPYYPAWGILVISNNNTLIGNNASNNTDYGISLGGNNNTLIGNNASNNDNGISLGGNNNTLIGNNASNNGVGIGLSDSSNNMLIGNNANSNGEVGIFLYWNSKNNTLISNTASLNNYYGIYLGYSSKSVLINNIMNENNYNFGLDGNSYIDFDNRIDTTNLVDEKPVYYIKGAIDMIYDPSTNAGTFYCISCVNITLKNLDLKTNANGIFFWNTTRSKIQNVNVSHNRDGISLEYSNNNTLNDNNVSNNGAGIGLGDSSNNILSGNNASNNEVDSVLLSSSSNNTLIGNNVRNSSVGIFLDSSSNNTLSGNNASNNYYGINLYSSSNKNILSSNNVSTNFNGIFLSYSSNNKIYHNTLVDNTNQAEDNMNSNSWDNGYPSGGNYWSDYTGVDLKSGPGQNIPGSDGIGDTPYKISGDAGAQDRYPLMGQIANLIKNPGFESGKTNWTFYTSGTGTFTAVSPGYEGTKAAKLALGSSGTNIQLYQTGVTLESNTRYRLSFTAYSMTGHDIKVNLFRHGSPYTNYGLAQTFNLGTNWQTFSTEFTTKGFTGIVSDGRFQFWFAPFVTGVDTYYIDDVRLDRVI